MKEFSNIRRYKNTQKSIILLGITSHLSEWPSPKNLQTINVAEGVEKREPSYTVGEMQTSTATMENSVAIP